LRSTDDHLIAADAPFLGRGWAFPPSFGRGGGEVATVAGAADVAESLQIIFATELGERAMREDFGAGLAAHVFAPVDRSLLTELRAAIIDAVMKWEPRIDIERVDIDEDGDEAGQLLITLGYTLRGANSRYNLVYPFNDADAVGAPR